MTIRTGTTDVIEPTNRHPLIWLRDIGIPVVGVPGLGEKRAAVETALATQCGESWRGFARAPLHVQVILTICALQIQDGRSDARALQLKLAAAAAYVEDGFIGGAAVRSLMEPFLADERFAGEIDERSKGNGFVNTALITNIEAARRSGGVFGPAEILWLHRVDVHAWAAVNSLDRKRHFVEAAGCMAHWLAERADKAPIAVPEVGPAIDTLDQYIAAFAAAYPQGPNHAH
jgi:hypothetical protein